MLAIWREHGDRDEQARELNSLGIVHRHLGEIDAARALLEQSIAISRQLGNTMRLGAALANLGQLESAEGRFDQATAALSEALALDEKNGDLFGVAIDKHSLVLVSLRNGRPGEARGLLHETLGYVESSGDTSLLVNTLELAAAIAARMEDVLLAARLAGAADALRQESGMLISEPEAAMLDEYFAPARGTAGDRAWHAGLAAGRALSQQEAIELLRTFGGPA
jgi:tetratricopeptide (TPR) repeat protein